LSVGRTTRLILDQGIPRDAAAMLRERGYECTHVGEIGKSRAADEEILAWSLQQEAAVVTLDADFHTMLAVSGAAGPSVIRIRRQGLDALAVVGLIEIMLAEYELDLTRGGSRHDQTEKDNMPQAADQRTLIDCWMRVYRDRFARQRNPRIRAAC
jgi:predicted nuclease of predicted toxin-antitoxin system